MKKIISLILVILIIIMSFGSSFQILAQEIENVSENFIENLSSVSEKSYYSSGNATNAYNINGVYYTIDHGTAMVVGCDATVSGEVTIQSTVNGVTVKSIQEYAFADCNLITDITIPETVTFISNYAFKNCTSLTSIIIPDSVTSLYSYAFDGCSSLKSVSLSKNITSIYEYTFNNCINLEDIIIPESITRIENGAFCNCTSLKEISIPESVFRIGSSAFNNCTSLNNIVIPESVTVINSWVFYGCTSLTNISLHDGIVDIDYNSFNQTGYYNDLENWENDVLYIGNHLIEANDNNLNEYTVKSGTKTIANCAFNDCYSLTSVTIPESVVNISVNAFCNCQNLTDLIIKNGVQKISDFAFSYCSSLSNITLPDSINFIGQFVFRNTAYYNNQNNWDNDVLYIGNHLIDVKTTVSGEFIAKEGTKTVASFAFDSCALLTSIIIPESVVTIGFGAFKNCNSLISLNIPFAPKSFDISQQDDYAALTYLFGATYQYNNSSCVPASLKNVTVTTANKIGLYTTYRFGDLSNIENITLDCNVSVLDRGLFIGCSSLKTITLPKSLTVIEDSAFLSCDSLKTIYFKGTEEDWEKIEIKGNNSPLNNVEIIFYCSCGENDFTEWETITQPTCTTEGLKTRRCNNCGEIQTKSLPKNAHEFVDGKCKLCGNDSIILESEHNYKDNANITYTAKIDNAEKLQVAFSSDTYVESFYDMIYISDKNNNLIGMYTGSSLQNETIIVPGDTVNIQLVSNISNTAYGFKAKVKPFEPQVINLNENVNINTSEEFTFFSFTPTESGTYTFYSGSHTYDELYDSGMRLLQSGSGTNAQCWRIKYGLEAGETYYFSTRSISNFNGPTINVRIEKSKSISKLEIKNLPRKQVIRGYNDDFVDLSGLELYVTMPDNTIITWSYDRDDTRYIGGEVIMYTYSFEENYKNITITCGTGEVTVKIPIIENPVDHIELVKGTSKIFIENYDGYYDGNDFIYYVYTHQLYDAQIKIVYKDGTSQIAAIDEYVNGYSVNWSHNQDGEFGEPWVVGTNNESTISYLGHTVNMPITVEKNPVAKLEVNSGSIICYENAYGNYEGDTFIYNYDTDNISLKVTYIDGTTKIMSIYDYIDGYYFMTESNQNEKPWVLGNDNYLTISFMGIKTQMPVSVIPNPVERIEINTAPSREYVYGDAEYGYIYDDVFEFYPDDLTGLSFTVYYTDGSQKVFTHEDIENDKINGSWFYIDYDFYNPSIGEFPVEFMYMGQTDTYTVKLKDTPVKSIAITKQPTQVIYTEGYYPTFFGMEFTITYKDGSTKVVKLTEENTEYSYYVVTGSVYYKINIDGYNLLISAYSYEDYWECDATYLGSKYVIDNIEFSPNKEISSIDVEDFAVDGDNMKLNINYIDGTAETITLEAIDSFHPTDTLYYNLSKTDKGLITYSIEVIKDENGNDLKYLLWILGEEVIIEPEEEKNNGDFDGNGIVNAADVALLKQAINSPEDFDNLELFDLNGDSSVDLLDLIAIKKIISDALKTSCDVNSDGVINSQDLSLLKRVILMESYDHIYDDFSLCDVNLDCKINILDLITMKKILAESV